MKDRLGGPDYRFLAICLALLAATIWYSVQNFSRAFPEASIDFRVSREEGRSLALAFLNHQNHHLEGYRQAASFTFDNTSKTFLEREAGLEEANRIMGTKVRLWRWSYRWFRPQQKEEFRVDITPRGEFVGFEHELPENAARPTAGEAEARTLAEDFLRTQVHRDPASLEFVESSDVSRPLRTDRVYTWQQRDFNLHDSTNRVEVTILGSEAGAYREYLKVPEQWSRDYRRLRSKNEVASTVDSAVMVALLVGLIVVILIRIRRQDVPWRVAGMIGMAGMLLSFCSQLNQLPLEEFAYPTTDSYTSFMTRQLLQAVIGALGAGGMLFVFTAGAEPLYREAFGEHVSLGNLFSLRSLRTKRFFLGSVLGITLTGIFVAYQTGFYIVASRFGAWSPADVPYSDLLNTRFPWLFVLLGGFMPAVSEEFLFRMFSIPFLKKLVRSTVLALLLAGFIWGFGHSSYPQQPFYIRGVEVGIGGVALGLVMLRWGILPTLVWHYSVDALYTAMLLLRSDSLYLRLSGAASAGVIALPVVVALVAYWRNGGFEPVEDLLNCAEPQPVEVPRETSSAPPTELPRQAPLSARARFAAIAIFTIGLLAFAVPAQRFGDSPTYKITQQQARAASDGFLRTQVIDPAGFRQVTFPAAHWSGDDSLAGKYFLERKPLASASELFEHHRPIQHWATRYFKSLDKEEVLVTIHPETAKVMGYQHTLPDDRPGADISEDAAREIAAGFAASMGVDTNAMELKEKDSEKKKARRDYTLVWEARPGDPRNVDETHFRVEVEVDGDRPVSLRSYWKVPEAYARSRLRENFISITVATLRFGALAAGIVFGLWLMISNVRQGLVPWSTTIKIAVPAALLSAVAPLLSMELMLARYNTAIPLQTYQAMTYVVVLMSVVFAFLLIGGAAALLTSLFPESIAALRGKNRRLLGRDAAAALIAAAGLGLLVFRSSAVLEDRFHAHALFSLGSPDLIINAVPALAAITGAFRSILISAAALGTFTLIAARLSRRWMLAPMVLLTAFAILPLNIRTPGEFALQYGIAVITVAAGAAFCLAFARGNYLAYALVLWAMALREPLGELFSTAIPAVQIHGWIVAAAIGIAVIWALLPAARGRIRRSKS